MKRRTLAVGIGATTTVVVAVVIFALLGTVWGVPEVRVVNDLNHDVGLRNCKDWQRIRQGTPTTLRPYGPCSVYRVNGDLIGYLGCLYFPDSAFTKDEPLLVSKLDERVSQPDCADGESYLKYSANRKAMKEVRDWIWD